MKLALALIPLFASTAALAAPAKAAPEKPAQERDGAARPVTQREVGAVDVVATPVTDLNLRKDEIPALLQAASDNPYGLEGLGNCRRIAAAVRDLDTTLGGDIDLPAPDGKASPGRMAQAAIRGLIPFGGLIREISGANAHERRMQAAIMSGVARRSFLKGVGQAKGCAYPARSATPAIVAVQATAISGRSAQAER